MRAPFPIKQVSSAVIIVGIVLFGYWATLYTAHLIPGPVFPGSKYATYHALLEAIEHKDVATVKRLLTTGADPNVYPNDPASIWAEADLTLLNSAAFDGDLEIVRLLLEHGADPNQGDGWNDNPLAAATHGDYLEVMKLLIARGAKVNDDLSGSSALWRAAMDGKTVSVAFLLAHGANPNTTANTSEPDEPLSKAVRSSTFPEQKAVIVLLLAAGAKE